VIRVRIYWPVMPIYRSEKGSCVLEKGSFFKNLLNRTYFCFSLSSGNAGAESWIGAVIPDVVGYYVMSGAGRTVVSTVYQTEYLPAVK